MENSFCYLSWPNPLVLTILKVIYINENETPVFSIEVRVFFFEKETEELESYFNNILKLRK
jgi:hypothetical protein